MTVLAAQSIFLSLALGAALFVAALIFYSVRLAIAGLNLSQDVLPGSCGSLKTGRMRFWICLCLALLAGLSLLFRDAYSASNCDVSDSVEYMVAAQRFFETGRLNLVLGGSELPSRFTPWFSAAILSPAYFLVGPEIGNAVYPVTLFALLGVLFAYLIGYRLAKLPGGVFAVFALLLIPGYCYFSRQILTDIPAAVLVLILAQLFLLLRLTDSKRTAVFFLAGVLGALSAALRPMTAASLLPFLIELYRTEIDKRFFKFVCLTAPSVLMIAGTMFFNARVIGSAFRSGYHLWLAVPYDYLNLTFSLSYLGENIWTAAFAAGLLPLLLVICAYPFVIKPALAEKGTGSIAVDTTALKAMIEYSIITAVPLLAFHLLYFYSTSRFYLPIQLLLAVVAGALLGGLMRLCRVSWKTPAVLLLLLAVTAFPLRSQFLAEKPQRRASADLIAANTESDSIIISAVNPVLLTQLAGGNRQIIPISRRIEFASKVLAWRRLTLKSAPPNWQMHRSSEILRAGAKEAVQHVAIDAPELIKQYLLAGRRVYLDASFLTREEFEVLQSGYRLKELAPQLYQLNLLDLNQIEE